MAEKTITEKLGKPVDFRGKEVYKVGSFFYAPAVPTEQHEGIASFYGNSEKDYGKEPAIELGNFSSEAYRGQGDFLIAERIETGFENYHFPSSYKQGESRGLCVISANGSVYELGADEKLLYVRGGRFLEIGKRVREGERQTYQPNKVIDTHFDNRTIIDAGEEGTVTFVEDNGKPSYDVVYSQDGPFPLQETEDERTTITVQQLLEMEKEYEKAQAAKAEEGIQA